MQTNLKIPSTIEQIRAHRSVRSFKPDPVPSAWVETIIETAQWASSTCFRQMYSVIAVKDPQTKIELMRLCGGQQWVADCPVFLAFCADMHRLDDICREDGKQVNLEYTETLIAAVLDTGLLMQNAALAAEALGLGMVMIGGLRDHPREIISLLSLPKGVFGISGMCLGFPETIEAQRPRLPLDEVLHWEHYDPIGRFARLEAYDDEIRSAGVYKRKNGAAHGWTEVMARTTSKPPAEEGRRTLREILKEQGFAQL
jgi:FMN reductase (NADPH)